MRTKTSVTILMAGLLVLLATWPAAAQISPTLKADIPFEFVAGTTTMAAGEYTVEAGTNPAVVAIRSADLSAQAFALTHRLQANGTPEQAKLVFRKHGDRYFLAQIWTAGTNLGRELPVSKIEHELTKQAANFEVVAVLAKR